MKNVLILGATGQIASWVVRGLGQLDDVQQTLLLRDPRKLSGTEPDNARVVIGNVLDQELLREVMAGQDIVYANLGGDDLEAQARSVIDAMRASGVKRLIFVLSLGIYDEIPGRFGEWNHEIIGEPLKYYRRAADAIEASGLDFTILRPAWLTDEDEVDHEITGKDELFRGTVVSRRSVGDLVIDLIRNPGLHVGANLGVNKPGSDGDKPYFM
ncbi:SDR family oxidoreductase [Pseudomonas aeruginosa]|uniref:SDR family oxidoreductase n=1 Tax=Pseudomonas aeruginosa TaxID=287 RepID=UPI00032D6C48|nr:SDR family oxidoreductase [Pseudomonas aeruginosa]EOQ80831.1 NAD-dependent epimerase/dehydratase [Pseudomonas aeruginosa VRFPA02]EIU3494558.1 SDR family oxidoreductase [Pseudomonas aeruginosa]KSN26245.1 NAD-dependent dehydratase [Pseudomonas aeruginosa]MBI7404911.1 SDR family oxidoreductase [Pseudomonas aeruginosa]MBK1797622.1 SDR family oxidoreductase [Pseudomonas aeruginosa]